MCGSEKEVLPICRAKGAMRITLEFADPTRPGATFKIKLPKSWYDGPVSRVKALFVESYAKKHGGADACAWMGDGSSSVHLISHDGRPLPDGVLVKDVIKEHDIVKVAVGTPPESLAAAASIPPPPSTMSNEIGANGGLSNANELPLCRNFGCQQRFDPSDNSDGVCAHHTAGPTFRDGQKVWPCCNASHWDWEGFLALDKCAKGRHSTEAPAAVNIGSPSMPVQSSEAAPIAAAVKSIASYNAENADAPTAAGSAARSLSAALSSMSMPSSSSSSSSSSPQSSNYNGNAAGKAQQAQTPRESDGRLSCRRIGCGKWFLPDDASEDGDSSCVFHGCGQPVFHEGSKSWQCYKGSFADWEGFMAHPGCCTGRHQA